MESALLGLQRRLPQLMKDVVELEEHHDEDLYSVLSLHVLENELIEIQLLMDKLNGSIRGNRELAVNTTDLVGPPLLHLLHYLCREDFQSPALTFVVLQYVNRN